MTRQRAVERDPDDISSEVILKEYTLKSLAQGKLRIEDRCAVMRLADSCSDMSMSVREIYRMAGV